MRILAIDFETQGFVPSKECRITEIGAILFEWHGPGVIATYPTSEFNRLIYEPGFPTQTEEIVELTGITDTMLQSEGVPFLTAVHELATSMGENEFDFFMAHNRAFDEKFFKSEMDRVESFELKQVFNKKWLCSMNDIEHPKKFKCKKLSHLALDYGIPVDPGTLHRAVADVKLLVEIVVASKVDLNYIAGRSELKTITIRAVVPSPYGLKGDGGIGKEKAKSCGFNWDGKHWIKECKEEDIPREKEKLGYEVSIICT